MENPYPPIISTLPEADLPMPGVRGWLLQGESRQAVFFQLPPETIIPEHAHGPQWGHVLQGEIELTVAGICRTYRRGDSYEVPDGAPHSARCPGGALILDLFADPGRYRAKP